MMEPIITQREKDATRKLAQALAEEKLNPVESLTVASLLVTAIAMAIFQHANVPNAQAAALRLMDRVFEYVTFMVLAHKAKEGGLQAGGD
ncbi:MAG TPA: hypothetical protein VIK75_09270 [Calditerricola sp.]